MKKIGTSFSMCVSDIVNGRIDYDDVEFIVTSTRYTTRDEMIAGVTMVHQRKNADEYIAMAARLWDDGKIYQPTIIENRSTEPRPTWIEFNQSDQITSGVCKLSLSKNLLVEQVTGLIIEKKYLDALIEVNRYCQQLQSHSEKENSNQGESAYDIIFERSQHSIASMVYALEKSLGKPFSYTDPDTDYWEDAKAFIHALHVYTNSFDQEYSAMTSSTKTPRPITPEEGVDILLSMFATISESWANNTSVDRREACNGVVFSILSLLDGHNVSMPAFDLYPHPHVDDLDFCIRIGENYWTDQPINSGMSLHTEWKKFERS